MTISDSTEITLTTQGRTRSSLQALRTGGAGHVVIMPKETGAAYELHFRSFMDHFQPKGLMETTLVRKMVNLQWRMDRASVFETNMLALSEAERQSALDSDQDEATIGFAGAAGLRRLVQGFATLSIYEQRLARLYDRASKELRLLQGERAWQEKRSPQPAESRCE